MDYFLANLEDEAKYNVDFRGSSAQQIECHGDARVH